MKVHLNTKATEEELRNKGYDVVVVATGVRPRKLKWEGKNIVSYEELITGKVKPGKRVVIIGGGGIGFDVASFLIGENSFDDAWGIDKEVRKGGIGEEVGKMGEGRQIVMMQRKSSKFGEGLGKTTGWIHRAMLKKAGVKMMAGVEYENIDEQGVYVIWKGKKEMVEADMVVVCAGQEREDEVRGDYIIGGASRVGELDAERAMREGAECGVRI